MAKKAFNIDHDLVIAGINLPVRIEIRDGCIHLYIGPHDWQWDFDTEEFIGSGTHLEVPEED